MAIKPQRDSKRRRRQICVLELFMALIEGKLCHLKVFIHFLVKPYEKCIAKK
jgi:hypothetical protein